MLSELDAQVDDEQEERNDSTIGCRVHTHLLNSHYTDLGTSPLHFLEFYELGGQISEEYLMQQAYLDQEYHGLIVAFDLNNLKSMKNLPMYLRTL